MGMVTSMKSRVARFVRDESGEVTIEWVAITAAIVALSTALLMQIGDGTRQLSDNVGTEMTERDVTTTY